ncbi:MAG TPA: gfo/Idh/MocA family oxidoreductase, partial [Planctomycetaceae bacterium]|nr:gfo/Idh/MocA family oxidoreductase [Planctomycetaceae bacterium]
MRNRRRITRRRFLRAAAQGTAAGTCAWIAPSIVPASALGRGGTIAPSNRITMGLIGCGGHGTGWNLDRMFQNPVQ